jgi:Protein of unknown function (DUF3631)
MNTPHNDASGVVHIAAASPGSSPGLVANAQTPEASVQPRPLGKLLDGICEILQRYVFFQLQEQVTAGGLWVVHTWVLDAFDYTPYLHVHSAEKRSGKSRLLDVLVLVVRGPWRTAGVSLAALFRKVERDTPTLLYDEIDTVFRSSKNDDTKDIQGFLNAGFERGATFCRCVGQNANLDIQEFQPFCPKALSGIGEVLPDTTADRCLPIELVRQSREEKTERFRKREAEAVVANIRTELEAWAQQPEVIEKLREARPDLPEELTDRQQDICEPLLAIADLAGGEWPDKARGALVKLCCLKEDASSGVTLLADIRDIFNSTGEDKMTTKDLLERLTAIEADRPYAFWWEDALKNGRLKASATKLAKLVKPYGVTPRKIRIGNETVRGYYRADFAEAWERYLPKSLPSLRRDRTNGTNGTHSSLTETSCSVSDMARRNVPCSPVQNGTRVPLAKSRVFHLFRLFRPHSVGRRVDTRGKAASLSRNS